MKEEHRLGRNYLGGIEGDRMNPILAASAEFIADFFDGLKQSKGSFNNFIDENTC